jgi:predicted SprT family Zn-dependent metalloprotease
MDTSELSVLEHECHNNVCDAVYYAMTADEKLGAECKFGRKFFSDTLKKVAIARPSNGLELLMVESITQKVVETFGRTIYSNVYATNCNDMKNVSTFSYNKSILSRRYRLTVFDQSNCRVEQSEGDFYLPFLDRYINLDAEPCEWKIVSIKPDLKEILPKLSRIYFANFRSLSRYKAQWSDAFDDAVNFKIDPIRGKILLNSCTLLKCSRGGFIGVLLHVLIHCAVYDTSNSPTTQIDDHDEKFTEIMDYLNEHLNLNINTKHRFQPPADEIEFYQCEGRCASTNPFKSISRHPLEFDKFKRRLMRDPYFDHEHYDFDLQIFDYVHSKSCDGILRQVFLAQRNTYQKKEEIYLINTEFDGFQKKNNDLEGHKKIIDPIDIQEHENALKSFFFHPVIDLYDFQRCPFCKLRLDKFSSFDNHLNLCFGMIQSQTTTEVSS